MKRLPSHDPQQHMPHTWQQSTMQRQHLTTQQQAIMRMIPTANTKNIQ